VLIEPCKGQVRKMPASLGESLRGDLALEIGLIGKMGKERVQFGLNAGFEA
jgi:hypothetical protein